MDSNGGQTGNPVVREFRYNDELVQYKKLLQKNIESTDDVLIFNDGQEYAALMLSTMFDNAKSSVCIYADTLRDDLCLLDIYFNSLKRCLENPDIEVRFLLSPHVKGKSQVRDFIENNSFKNVEIRCDEKLPELMGKELDDDAHFTVVDDRMYRVEYDITNFKAMASFNSKEYAGQLRRTFDKINDKLNAGRLVLSPLFPPFLMVEIHSALQIVACVYLSFLFEGLFSVLCGVEKSFEKDVNEMASKLQNNLLRCGDNSEIYRIEDLKKIPSWISKRCRRFIHVFATIGFISCFALLLGRSHAVHLIPSLADVDCSSPCVVWTVHITVFLPLVFCFSALCLLPGAIGRGIGNAIDTVSSRGVQLSEFTEKIALPSSKLSDVLHEIGKYDSEYEETFNREYVAKDGSLRVALHNNQLKENHENCCISGIVPQLP